MWTQPKYSKARLLAANEKREDPADWEEGEDDEGVTFYHNIKTGESRWMKPTFKIALLTENGEPSMNAEWEELQDEDGVTYFFNNNTQESTWEKVCHHSEPQLVVSHYLAV